MNLTSLLDNDLKHIIFWKGVSLQALVEEEDLNFYQFANICVILNYYVDGGILKSKQHVLSNSVK